MRRGGGSCPSGGWGSGGCWGEGRRGCRSGQFQGHIDDAFCDCITFVTIQGQAQSVDTIRETFKIPERQIFWFLDLGIIVGDQFFPAAGIFSLAKMQTPIAKILTDSDDAENLCVVVGDLLPIFKICKAQVGLGIVGIAFTIRRKRDVFWKIMAFKPVFS